jgi:hypothetical protein
MSTETIKFNVGGHRYEVSNALFDKYPYSSLAKIIQDNKEQNPGKEIFLDRDGTMFDCVLSYIRDGKVFLPYNVVKERLVLELEHYGIDCEGHDYIYEKPGNDLEHPVKDNAKTMKTTETVKFNVGGQKYEVSRSLFDKCPDSMLARSVSEQWLRDPAEEIFIDRDGTLFGCVLSFLRDGKVFLPYNMVKERLVVELEYYGIEGDNEEYFHEKSSIHSINNFVHFAKDLENKQAELLYQQKCIEVALYCLIRFATGRLGWEKPSDWSFTSNDARWVLYKDGKDYESVCSAWNIIRLKQDYLGQINQILKKVALTLIKIEITYKNKMECFAFEVQIVDDNTAPESE